MGNRDAAAAAASGAQIFSQHQEQQQQLLKRLRKRKTTTPADAAASSGLGSCTTHAEASRIQGRPSRVAAKPDNLQVWSSLSWGAKRSRTALARRRRDWSNLDDGPAGLIAERVLDKDMADYIRFRAVCLPWRRCSPDPRAIGVLEDRRFHPRRWIMLLGEEERLEAVAAPHCSRRHFLNVSTGQCIQIDVPELRDHGALQSTAEGLLVLLHKDTQAVRLLNPLTRQTALLPPITGLGDHFTPGYIGSSSRSTAGLADDSTVVLYSEGCGWTGTLAFAKPGDQRWVVIKTNIGPLMPTMSYAGRFYGVTSNAIMTVDMSGGEDMLPRLVVAAKLAKPFDRMMDTVHLVDNDGKLMLLHRMLSSFRNQFKRTYKVYRVDLKAGKTTTRGGVGLSLSGRAVFIGRFRALSVSPQAFPAIDANTVYPGLNLDEEIGAYHLRDGSTEPSNYDSRSGLVQPWSIAECLAAYVSG